jgi:hypothetical protein
MIVPVLMLAAALYAQCPLGFSPDQACAADSPSCGLFSDGSGNGLCDNPGPQPVQEEAPAEEPEPVPETPAESDPAPETATADERPAAFCPLGLAPLEACAEASPRCALYEDRSADGHCDNPGPRPPVTVEENTPEASPEDTPPHTATQPDTIEEGQPEEHEEEEEQQEPLNGDEPEEQAPEDAAEAPRQLCPLGFTVEEACFFESPSCALFIDTEGNGRCDNPGTQCGEDDPDCGLEAPSIIGCPLGLPPAGACPDSLALCPHWYGVTTGTVCSNPSGGHRRVNIVLITLAVLLPVSTWLSRRFYGRRLKDRLKRNTAHQVVRGVSLMILGFGVQGCFCPLGTFQYAFTAGGLAFLGLSGLVIFVLPLLFSGFFGRVFCGWVCPMGAVQEFLYSIHVPGRFSPSGKVHLKLRYLNHLILFGLIGVILLDRFDLISLPWSAPFCRVDPFHTMFTLFLSGSLVIAGMTIILAIFVRRFFCRYLCFYGAAQSILARLTLWNRITGRRRGLPEMDSDEEFDS